MFNLAMLAKQALRLIHGMHSLFYCVYKTRYFPTYSFMDVKLGSNPSFVWCSLLQARKLLQKGLAWKIGDSETIGIDSHKRLPNPPSFKPGADRILKVSALFNPDTRQWDRSLIHALSHNSTTDDILRIKLGHSRSRDKLMWMETKSRTFSVKTAYQVALRLHRLVTGRNSC